LESIPDVGILAIRRGSGVGTSYAKYQKLEDGMYYTEKEIKEIDEIYVPFLLRKNLTRKLAPWRF
jgi:hypothetical protein